MKCGCSVRQTRVTFIINSMAGGGAERVMATLLAHSRDECAEFSVSLVLLDDEPDDYEIPEWVKVERLGCGGSVWRSVSSLTKLFARNCPDATLSFLTRSNVANVLAMRGRGASVISARIHTSVHLRAKPNMALRLAVRTTYPRANRVIAVANDLGADLCANFGVDAARIVSIPNPVDAARIKYLAGEPLPIRVDGEYILAAGRLVGIKNFELLIRAVAMSGLPHKVVILGDGPDRGDLTRLAQDVGLTNRVILPGRLQNPFPLIAGADLFALSSNGEGFPNVLVEAMALAVPVVATDCPSGPSEILADAPRGTIHAATLSPYGVLTPPNDVSEFAAALSFALDPGTRTRLAASGPVRAAHYDPIEIKNRYWSVLREEIERSDQEK